MSRTPKNRLQIVALADFLAQCARVAREHGWTSAKDATAQDTEPSADVAFQSALLGTEATDDDRLTAQKALALFSSRAQSSRASEFDHKTADLIDSSGGQVNSRTYRQVGAIMGFYQRVVTQAAIVASQPPSFHLGAVGDRMVFTAEVSHVSYFQGRFSSWIVNMVTPEGARLSWFTSAPLEVGKTYTLRGTVKAHREFQGRPQTVMTRCIEVVAETAAA